MKKIIFTLLLILITKLSYSAPILNFSDITNGPRTGNSDGVGSGVIVTIWGNNLGSTQGTSKVYIGAVEATAVYYWRNADGQLPSGPADLYTNHKMQEIAFSVPATAVVGANTISVTVNGETSNTLPFTVRSSGNIYFIKSTGNDTTGNGSWSNPWLTYNSVFIGGGSKIIAGDTVYSCGVTSTSGIRIGGGGHMVGTDSMPFALIAYPNTRCNISGHSGNGAVISNYYAEIYNKAYVHIAKLSVTAVGNSGDSPMGVEANPYNRIIGMEITGPTVYGGYFGAIGCSGLLNNPPVGGKYYGIYIHNYGYRSTIPGLNNYGWIYSTVGWTNPDYDGIGDACTNCLTMDRYQHLYYLTIRANNIMTPPYEIAWNNLVNNPILEGIHIYDYPYANSGFTGPIKVYNNWIENQGGPFFDFELNYAANGGRIEVYNNVSVCDPSSIWSGPAIVHAGNEDVKMYNNTFYGWRITGMSNAGSGPGPFDFRNNIMFDTIGASFASLTPTTHTNNLFYSSQGTSLPGWYSSGAGDKNANPSFVNASAKDFTLNSNSPAISSGVDFSSLFTTDFFNNTRSAWDMGAITYSSGSPSSVVTNIISTQTGQTVSTTPFTIHGTASTTNGATITGVTINGQTVTPDTSWGSSSVDWTCNANLVNGLNSFTAIATDSNNNTGNASITVTYDPPVANANAVIYGEFHGQLFE